MILSIIIPTINRKIELDELLSSILKHLNNISFEIILIDQNVEGFLDDLLFKYNKILNISHYLVGFKGLSKARNFGVKLAKGEYITFPDDDCRIFSDTYSKALELFIDKKVNIVFGRCIDSIGKDSVLNFKKESCILNVNNMSGGFVEATGVIHKSIFDKGFYFDENMGAGCFHGAEEGYDWLYRIFTESSFSAYYSAELIFYHPQVVVSKGSSQSLRRAFTYSCGNAYLCKKHKFYYRYFKRIILVFFSIPFFLIVNRHKAKYYFSELLGLLIGRLI